MGYAAAAAAVVGIAGGVMESENAKTQAHQQTDAQRETNLMNLAQYIASRGGDPGPIIRNLSVKNRAGVEESLKSAGTILPGYAGQGTEKELFDSALSAGKLAGGDPQNDILKYRQILEGQRPAIEGGNALIGDIFSGQMLTDQINDMKPMLQARFGLSEAEAQAVEAGLAEQLNSVAASDASKGFTGGGSVVNNRLLAATIEARNKIAVDKANAVLQNEADILKAREGNRDLQIRSLDVPINRANQLIRAEQLPGQAVVDAQLEAQRPLAFFKLNPGNPPEQRAAIPPSTPSTGGVIASGVSQGISGYNNARLKNKEAESNKQLADAISATGGGWGGGW